MIRHFILGTAGHIDHGKSTLVKALTGIDPDRLPEEKARGMTIELGFGHFALTDPEDQESGFSLGVVDVPGHADFVRNMLAGVSGLDVALFVVAADDGWMPQSEEHLQILGYLGIAHAVIALTKADLAEDIEFSTELLREEIRGTFLAEAPIVPVAAPAGRGIEELKATLVDVLRNHPGPQDIGKPRLHVDRAFSATGVGTVVTGTLMGGSLAGGTEAIVQPWGLPAHIRSVQSHRSRKDHARPGMRTALNLSNVPLAARDRKSGVARGQVVTLPRFGQPSAAVDVLVEKSARPVAGQPGFTRPLRHGQRVRVHHGAATHDARIHFSGRKTVAAGESALAELRLDFPAHVFANDRFVLRDWSKRYTVGGGVILDPDARGSDFRKGRQKAFLAARAENPDDASAAVAACLQRDKALPREGMLLKSHFSETEIRKAMDTLVKSKAAVAQAGWLIEARWWSDLITRAAEMVQHHHKMHPEAQGLSLTQIRSGIGPSLPEARLFDVLIAELTRNGFARSGEVLRAGHHQAVLPLALQEAGNRLRELIARSPFDPPNPAELTASPTDQQALRVLIENGELIELAERAVVSREAFEKMKACIVAALRDRQQATASELREIIGTTRRILIPLLERLDREGITRRSGDLRTLR